MQTKFILIFSFMSISFISAQNISYSGIIIEINKEKDTEFTIALINTKNSAVKFSEVALNNFFHFTNIPVGKYYRCISYENINQCDSIYLTENISNDTIKILNDQKLAEVVVTSKKKLIENKQGILTINVQNSPVMSSGNAFEMLAKLPGISFNMASDTFRLKGKSGVQIQIDDNTLYLTESELVQYLKTISAQDVNLVEINSLPSSKYDASGHGGIVNIKTKKNKREGFYVGASITSTQGRYYKQEQNIKFQFNTKKNKFFVQYSKNNITDFEKADTKRLFVSNETRQYTFAKIISKTNAINSQFEHQFKKSNLLLNSTLSFYDENIIQNTSLDFYSRNPNIDSTLISRQISHNKLKDYNIGVNYALNYDKSTFIIKSNFSSYKIRNTSDLSSYSLPSNFNHGNLLNKSPNNISFIVNQLDYEHKIDSNSVIQSGAKAIFQKIDNENLFFDIKSTIEEEQLNKEKSNDYRYNEWILGGYAQYKKTIKKIDFILGSRVEFNCSEGINNKNSYTLSNNKTNFFPFFSIAYNYSQTNNFNVSYSKRITRPTFNNLMPFNYYVDPNTILVGNPNLTPSISHQFELQYILKQNYVFAIDYSINRNEIFQTPLQNNEILSTILTPLNIKKGNSLSLSNNSTFDLFKWWNLNFNIVMFYDTIKSADAFLSINSYNWSSQFTTTNLFTFPNSFNLEIVSEYISPFIQGPYKTNYLFSLNSSISKTFLSKRLKTFITVNDILGTYKLRSTSIILDQYSFISQKFDTKWIRFGITYKLTKGIKKQIIETDSINEEIKSRTK